ncbi:DUF1847 domain-containing protein [Anaerolentibacter hominis]|uniref:DUF1847 domain-containing protein n=1 Tax=Anaerolentibacter hominis TaxID=3079009 RepID=UPI0031B89FD8
MYTCGNCTVHACLTETKENLPKNCPIRNEELMGGALKEYEAPDVHQFYVESSKIESAGYCQWPRMKEIVEFSKRMGYHKLGVAFCGGLRKEGKIVCDILRKNGFEVVSAICKAGGYPKETVGMLDEDKVRPGRYEPMCNPIAQAMLLNEQKTEFNITVGLCLGHDSLFYKYSEAYVTTLIAKDRVLAHNPAGALYCAESYFRDRI